MLHNYLLFTWHKGNARGGFRDFAADYRTSEEANRIGQRYVREAQLAGAKGDYSVYRLDTCGEATFARRQRFDGWFYIPQPGWAPIHLDLYETRRQDGYEILRTPSFLRFEADPVWSSPRPPFTEIRIPSLSFHAIPVSVPCDIYLSLENWPEDPIDQEFPLPAAPEPSTPIELSATDDRRLMTFVCNCVVRSLGDHTPTGCRTCSTCFHGIPVTPTRARGLGVLRENLVPLSLAALRAWEMRVPSADVYGFAANIRPEAEKLSTLHRTFYNVDFSAYRNRVMGP